MPNFLLSVELERHNITCSRISRLIRDASTLAPGMQHAIAEANFIRLAYSFEYALKGVLCKLACGASYLNGSAPQLNLKCNSRARAILSFASFDRLADHNAKWTRSKYIILAVEKVIDSEESCILAIDQAGTFIAQLFYIRNHIAHNNSSSRANYSKVLHQFYGTRIKSIPPGKFLVSSRFRPSVQNGFLRGSELWLEQIANGV